MTRSGNPWRVLAIDPTRRGFGFIILEGARDVVDWGVRSGRAASIEREQHLLAKVNDLLQQYRPHILILEDTSASESRRCGRMILLIETISNLSIWRKITVRQISISKVRKIFKAFGAQGKYEIACVIALQLPEIASWLPKPRKPWTGEHYRMAVFNAAALALAYFYGRVRCHGSRI